MGFCLHRCSGQGPRPALGLCRAAASDAPPRSLPCPSAQPTSGGQSWRPEARAPVMKNALSRTPAATSSATSKLIPAATGFTLLLPTLKNVEGRPHSSARKEEKPRATAALAMTCAAEVEAGGGSAAVSRPAGEGGDRGRGGMQAAAPQVPPSPAPSRCCREQTWPAARLRGCVHEGSSTSCSGEWVQRCQRQPVGAFQAHGKSKKSRSAHTACHLEAHAGSLPPVQKQQASSSMAHPAW